MRKNPGTPDITVVVCTYNRSTQLRQALLDVINQVSDNISFEVVVVNDASTDDTSRVIAQISTMSPVPLREVKADGSTLGAARNLGIREARGDWIAYFDDDQRAPKSWLAELWKVASLSRAEFVGGPIALELPPGVALGPAIRAIYGEYPPARGGHKQTPLPPGGNRLVSKEVFDRIGFHDESIVTGGEDYDLLMRAVKWEVAFAWAADAGVIHVVTRDRLERGAVRAYCQLAGASRARSDANRLSKPQLFVSCASRVVRGWLLNAPLLLSKGARKDEAGVADCRARWHLTTGYMRRGLSELLGLAILSRREMHRTFRHLRS